MPGPWKASESDKLNSTWSRHLQAVYICEVFEDVNNAFGPFATSAPIACLPVGGQTLVQHGLEALLTTGVKECHLLAKESTHAMIKPHVDGFQLKRHGQAMTINFVNLSSSTSCFGDALRDLDSQLGLQEDFIVISSGCVFIAANLTSAIEAHFGARKKFPEHVLTLVFMEAPPLSGLRGVNNDNLVVQDALTGRLVSLDNLQHRRFASLKPNLIERWSSTGECTVRYDLMDTRISIATPRLLSLFSEHFDYMELNEDFVGNLLTREVSLEEFHVFTLAKDGLSFNSALAVPITDPRVYGITCRNVVEGAAYPVVPHDESDIRGHTKLKHIGNRVYLAKQVEMAGAKLGPTCTVADQCRIGAGAIISGSTISTRCAVDKGTVIVDSIIGKDATIGANCQLQSTLCGSDVIIGDDVKVGSGCIIGSGVKIHSGKEIPARSWISKQAPSKGDLVLENPQWLTPEEGYLFPVPRNEAYLEATSMGGELAAARVTSTLTLEDYLRLDEVETSAAELDSSTSDAGEMELGEDNSFKVDVTVLATESLDEPQHVQHKVLELKSLRMVANKTDRDVLTLLFHIVLERFLTLPHDRETWAYYVKEHRLLYLFGSFMTDDEYESQALMMDQVLGAIEEDIEEKGSTFKTPTSYDRFSFMIELMVHTELIVPTNFLRWRSSKLEEDTENLHLSRPRCCAFARWLEDEE